MYYDMSRIQHISLMRCNNLLLLQRNNKYGLSDITIYVSLSRVSNITYTQDHCMRINES